jgi:hypothetical protein
MLTLRHDRESNRVSENGYVHLNHAYVYYRPRSVLLTIGGNIFVKEVYKPFERWEKTCHFLHPSLLLSALERLYKPLEKRCCIF